MPDFKPDPGWVEIPHGYSVTWGTVRNNPGAADHLVFDAEDNEAAARAAVAAASGKRVLATRQSIISALARWS